MGGEERVSICGMYQVWTEETVGVLSYIHDVKSHFTIHVTTQESQ